jgi:UDP-N-acetylglucosamine diphosphorylase/glucosamine-1-phosphate N-acetyltransferase
MKLVFSDDNKHLLFAPLTLTRPVADLRIGLFTIAERWQRMLNVDGSVYYETANPAIAHLNFSYQGMDQSLRINSTVLPTEALAIEVLTLKDGESLVHNKLWIAQKGAGTILISAENPPLAILQNRWDFYLFNDQVLRQDFDFYTASKESAFLSKTNTLIGDENQIFIEEGARIEACILNVSAGPIYIGKNAEVMEGAILRGPLALGEHATIKMGAKIYGATSIGPHCKVGGEISNSIFLAYSNKGHDGFIGNAYIGAWCNLGADTNCSNLKNNYGAVKTYCYATEKMLQTDQTFMGVFMGDHSKCAINTMFNTATAVGVCANIFSSGFPAKHIPSFTWGPKLEDFDLNKAFEVAEAMMKRRGLNLTDEEKFTLRYWCENKT